MRTCRLWKSKSDEEWLKTDIFIDEVPSARDRYLQLLATQFWKIARSFSLLISNGFFKSVKCLQVSTGTKGALMLSMSLTGERWSVTRLLGHDGFGHWRVFLYWLGKGCTKAGSGFFEMFEILLKFWFNMGIPKFVVVIEYNFPLFNLTCKSNSLLQFPLR